MRIDDDLLNKIADDFVRAKNTVSRVLNREIQMTFEQYLTLRLVEMGYK